MAAGRVQYPISMLHRSVAAGARSPAVSREQPGPGQQHVPQHAARHNAKSRPDIQGPGIALSVLGAIGPHLQRHRCPPAAACKRPASPTHIQPIACWLAPPGAGSRLASALTPPAAPHGTGGDAAERPHLTKIGRLIAAAAGSGRRRRCRAGVPVVTCLLPSPSHCRECRPSQRHGWALAARQAAGPGGCLRGRGVRGAALTWSTLPAVVTGRALIACYTLHSCALPAQACLQSG